MEGLWLIILIIGIISRIMEANKKKGKYGMPKSPPKPQGPATQKPKADLDVSPKKLIEQLTEDYEKMVQEFQGEKQPSRPEPELRSSVAQALEDRRLEEVQLEPVQEGHAMEGKTRGLEGKTGGHEGVATEGKPVGREGVATEGSYKKGSMQYQNGRRVMMEGSDHPLAAEIDFEAESEAEEPDVILAGEIGRERRDTWSSRIIWKEVLSEPVALRKRHGYR